MLEKLRERLCELKESCDENYLWILENLTVEHYGKDIVICELRYKGRFLCILGFEKRKDLPTALGKLNAAVFSLLNFAELVGVKC